jgi:multicomponent Na+:H+ antiporter subunit G
MDLQNFVSLALVLLGGFFMLVGSIGIVRLPDFFTRTHATGKTDTLGIMLVLGGLAVYEGLTISGLKLLSVIVFVGLINPVATHALTKTALQFGLKPWFRNDRPGEGSRKEDR